LMSSIYEEHKDEDGFLYITYSGENTFGDFWGMSAPYYSCRSSCLFRCVVVPVVVVFYQKRESTCYDEERGSTRR
jgi:hypothetical protein